MSKNQILVSVSLAAMISNTACIAAPAPKSSSSPGLALKALGFICGSIVGVPVSVVRNPIIEEKYGKEQLSCGSEQPRVTVPAGIFYFPFALATGVVEAPFSAVKHSWQNADHPFSKEQFSLGDNKKEATPGEDSKP